MDGTPPAGIKAMSPPLKKYMLENVLILIPLSKQNNFKNKNKIYVRKLFNIEAVLLRESSVLKNVLFTIEVVLLRAASS